MFLGRFGNAVLVLVVLLLSSCIISLAKSSSMLLAALFAVEVAGLSILVLAFVDALKNAFRMSVLGSGVSSLSKFEVLSLVRLLLRAELVLLFLSFLLSASFELWLCLLCFFLDSNSSSSYSSSMYSYSSSSSSSSSSI